MAVPRKPKLLFSAVIERKRYIRRGLWSLLAAAAAVGAALALEVAAGQGVIDTTLQTVGLAAGLAATVFFGLRAALNLWYALRRRTERLRFFDKGFAWEQGGTTYKYRWSQLVTFREGGRGIYFGQRPIIQWGAYRLTMQGGRIFRVTPAHGDLRKFGAAVRRYAAHYTGIRMSRILRDKEGSVKLHRRLVLWPGGIEIGRAEIPWSELAINLRNTRLVVQRRDAKTGRFRTFRSFDARRIDNVGGLLELAEVTIQNHRRAQFSQAAARRETG